MKEYNEEQLNEIHNVLHGNLTSEEQKLFFKRLESDPVLKQEFYYWKKIEEVSRLQAYTHAAHTVINKVFIKQPFFVVFWNKNKRIISIAASLLVFSAVGLYMYFGDSASSSQLTKTDKPTELKVDPSEENRKPQKPSANDVPLKSSFLLSSNLENIELGLKNPNLQNVLNSLNKGKNDVAKKSLLAMNDEETINDKPVNKDEKFGSSGDKSIDNPKETTKKVLSDQDKAGKYLLLGISYLKENNPKKALDSFSKMPKGVLANEKEWFESLAYLANGEKSKAKDMIESISNNQNHPYQTKASLLFDVL